MAQRFANELLIIRVTYCVNVQQITPNVQGFTLDLIKHNEIDIKISLL